MPADEEEPANANMIDIIVDYDESDKKPGKKRSEQAEAKKKKKLDEVAALPESRKAAAFKK